MRYISGVGGASGRSLWFGAAFCMLTLLWTKGMMAGSAAAKGQAAESAGGLITVVEPVTRTVLLKDRRGKNTTVHLLDTIRTFAAHPAAINQLKVGEQLSVLYISGKPAIMMALTEGAGDPLPEIREPRGPKRLFAPKIKKVRGAITAISPGLVVENESSSPIKVDPESDTTVYVVQPAEFSSIQTGLAARALGTRLGQRLEADQIILMPASALKPLDDLRRRGLPKRG